MEFPLGQLHKLVAHFFDLNKAVNRKGLTMKKPIILLLLLFCTAGFCNNPQENQPLEDRTKNIALQRLADLLIKKEYTTNLKMDYFLKIQAGLNLSNRRIFDELLQEIEPEKRAQAIKMYERLEIRMNEELHRKISEEMDLHGILRQINMDVYGKNYSTAEIIGLINFYSSELGQKFLAVSQSMIEETEQKNAEIMYPLSMRITEDIVDGLQKGIMEIIKNLSSDS